jgi:hypothetical protein
VGRTLRDPLDAVTRLPIARCGWSAPPHPLNWPRADPERTHRRRLRHPFSPHHPGFPPKDSSVFQRLSHHRIDALQRRSPMCIRTIWRRQPYGKGTVRILRSGTLAGRVPENAVLSHDLLKEIRTLCSRKRHRAVRGLSHWKSPPQDTVGRAATGSSCLDLGRATWHPLARSLETAGQPAALAGGAVLPPPAGRKRPFHMRPGPLATRPFCAQLPAIPPFSRLLPPAWGSPPAITPAWC